MIIHRPHPDTPFQGSFPDRIGVPGAMPRAIFARPVWGSLPTPPIRSRQLESILSILPILSIRPILSSAPLIHPVRMKLES